MKTIVVYYSGKGSNRFLAGKAADALGCELVELEPRLAPGVIFATAVKLSIGNKQLSQNFEDYDRVVLCGPIYMGSLAAPCSDFLHKYLKKVKKLDFITCCGSTDEKKNETFGYGKVFDKLEKRLGMQAGIFEAFPIELLLGEEQKGNDQAMMNIRMNEENFKGEIIKRLGSFVARIG
ncbi:MAG TPA: hypothetical protein DCO79_13365 [Spirochaeta sp.]|nr:hypothetical protein [Spirochaeta sp.]